MISTMNRETVRLWNHSPSGLVVLRSISAIAAAPPYSGDSSWGSDIAPAMVRWGSASASLAAVPASFTVA